MFILTLCACKSKTAAYIYSADDTSMKRPIAVIAWQDNEKNRILTQMIDEMYETARTVTTDVKMSYTVKLINNNGKNDVLQIGFNGNIVCGSGSIQGISIDKSHTTNITSDDIEKLLK